MEIRQSVMDFAMAMEEVLRENDHKGGWDHLSLDHLMTRLQEEVMELMWATEQRCPSCGQTMAVGERDRYWSEHGNKRFDPVKEAVDVANFAMMVREYYDD